MNAGDHEVVRKILERDGAAARPDLARRLGVPQAPTGGGYQPYRNPVDQDVYDEALL